VFLLRWSVSAWRAQRGHSSGFSERAGALKALSLFEARRLKTYAMSVASGGGGVQTLPHISSVMNAWRPAGAALILNPSKVALIFLRDLYGF